VVGPVVALHGTDRALGSFAEDPQGRVVPLQTNVRGAVRAAEILEEGPLGVSHEAPCVYLAKLAKTWAIIAHSSSAGATSWHGVREIRCPKGRYRKIFIVVINDRLRVMVQRARAYLKGREFRDY
jgi:hypothetical protein